MNVTPTPDVARLSVAVTSPLILSSSFSLSLPLALLQPDLPKTSPLPLLPLRLAVLQPEL